MRHASLGRWTLACGLGALLLAHAPRGADGTPFREGTTRFALGRGRRAERVVTYAGHLGIRVRWTVEGFAPPAGAQVLAYAATPGGRLVAVLDGGAQYSDDGGRAWLPARVEPALDHPVAVAMADDTFGVLATAWQGVWATRDGGQSWRPLREPPGNALDDVAVAGRTVVYADVRGGVWVTGESFGPVRTLCEPETDGRAASVTSDGGAVTVRGSERCRWRVDAAGGAERRGPE